ncbi:uncharacterized protein LALA0_S05e07756g [Lachancea lanzarotensis]|uniref:LALA0S05e07756g1_1 n=1 Tax=Lachancea lanzarotensis TaxID=1245769 RepID=A0A0C7MRL8_9SACH|nr:uncharacterized protein LALA0_S05e07756g [Lachancea lanzarotensis]CEP62533.1 LALA0S05e07756g1_1 [Lachancea lanzarotensis]
MESPVERPLTHGFLSLDPDSPDYALRSHTLPANATSIRQLVINKQNGRVIAAKSQLVGRMEDALIRWRPPVSCHAGSTAAVKGKHPYQLEMEENTPAHTSLESIRQCIETLGNAVIKPKKKSDTHRHAEESSLLHSVHLGDSTDPFHSLSSASGMLQEIRQSLQSTDTHGITPQAIECEQEPETCTFEPITYSFPIPAYYLPQETTHPVGESTRDNVNVDSNDGQAGTRWNNFWDQVCREFKILCACV